MAKQCGKQFFTGTIDGVCFYKMDGHFYARSKSSLSGKRVKRDPKFALTMRNAGWLKQASVIASGIYRQLPKDRRSRQLYQSLTGLGITLFKEGKTPEEVSEAIQRAAFQEPKLEKIIKKSVSAGIVLTTKRRRRHSNIVSLRSIYIPLHSPRFNAGRHGNRHISNLATHAIPSSGG